MSKEKVEQNCSPDVTWTSRQGREEARVHRAIWGLDDGSADNFDQTNGKVIEMAKDETTAEDAGKKPTRRFPFIVPY